MPRSARIALPWPALRPTVNSFIERFSPSAEQSSGASSSSTSSLAVGWQAGKSACSLCLLWPGHVQGSPEGEREPDEERGARLSIQACSTSEHHGLVRATAVQQIFSRRTTGRCVDLSWPRACNFSSLAQTFPGAAGHPRQQLCFTSCCSWSRPAD